MKIRTIITQDAEVDDRNSLRHFLLFANEVELQGIVQTSSKFHWRGVPGTDHKPVILPGEFAGDGHDSEPYDRPYRWPGTDWMFRVIDDYALDYPNLIKQSQDYPTPEYLRSITKVGNVGYKGEMETATEGSELIRRAILDDDERTLYLQVWGGCNTIARALLDIQAEYGNTPGWKALQDKITRKIVITACGEQDETYRTVIAEQWPGIQFVKTLQMGSYAYAWQTMPEGESKDSLRAAFMKPEILRNGSALAKGYCTWLDGTVYPGEGPGDQFGSNTNIAKEWFGARFGLTGYQQNDFLSEGDSPTFFTLFDRGMRTLEDFGWGGIGGRYQQVSDEKNSKGEQLNIWDVALDSYTDRDGNTALRESMWPYVAEIQREFAARVGWAAGDANAEHAPSLELPEAQDLTAAPGQRLTLHAQAQCPDGFGVQTDFRIYREISAPWAEIGHVSAEQNSAVIDIPANAVSGDVLHVIVRAQSMGHHRLVRYRRVIITVR